MTLLNHLLAVALIVLCAILFSLVLRDVLIQEVTHDGHVYIMHKTGRAYHSPVCTNEVHQPWFKN